MKSDFSRNWNEEGKRTFQVLISLHDLTHDNVTVCENESDEMKISLNFLAAETRAMEESCGKSIRRQTSLVH